MLCAGFFAALSFVGGLLLSPLLSNVTNGGFALASKNIFHTISARFADDSSSAVALTPTLIIDPEPINIVLDHAPVFVSHPRQVNVSYVPAKTSPIATEPECSGPPTVSVGPGSSFFVREHIIILSGFAPHLWVTLSTPAFVSFVLLVYLWVIKDSDPTRSIIEFQNRQRHLDTLWNELTQTHSQNEQLKQDVQQQVLENEASQALLTKLQAEKRKTEEQQHHPEPQPFLSWNEENKENEKLRSQIRELERSRKLDSKVLQQSREDLAKCRHELAALAAQHKGLQQGGLGITEDLKTELKQAMEERTRLENSHTEAAQLLQTELKQAREEYARLKNAQTRTARDAEIILKQSQESYEQVKGVNGLLQRDLDATKAERDRLRAQTNRDTPEGLEKVKKLYAKSLEDLKRMEAERDALRKDNAAIKRELAQGEDAYQAVVIEMNELESQLDALTSANKRHQPALTAAESKAPYQSLATSKPAPAHHENGQPFDDAGSVIRALLPSPPPVNATSTPSDRISASISEESSHSDHVAMESDEEDLYGSSVHGDIEDDGQNPSTCRPSEKTRRNDDDDDHSPAPGSGGSAPKAGAVSSNSAAGAAVDAAGDGPSAGGTAEKSKQKRRKRGTRKKNRNSTAQEIGIAGSSPAVAGANAASENVSVNQESLTTATDTAITSTTMAQDPTITGASASRDVAQSTTISPLFNNSNVDMATAGSTASTVSSTAINAAQNRLPGLGYHNTTGLYASRHAPASLVAQEKRDLDPFLHTTKEPTQNRKAHEITTPVTPRAPKVNGLSSSMHATSRDIKTPKSRRRAGFAVSDSMEEFGEPGARHARSAFINHQPTQRDLIRGIQTSRSAARTTSDSMNVDNQQTGVDAAADNIASHPLVPFGGDNNCSFSPSLGDTDPAPVFRLQPPEGYVSAPNVPARNVNGWSEYKASYSSSVHAPTAPLPSQQLHKDSQRFAAVDNLTPQFVTNFTNALSAYNASKNAETTSKDVNSAQPAEECAPHNDVGNLDDNHAAAGSTSSYPDPLTSQVHGDGPYYPITQHSNSTGLGGNETSGRESTSAFADPASSSCATPGASDTRDESHGSPNGSVPYEFHNPFEGIEPPPFDEEFDREAASYYT